MRQSLIQNVFIVTSCIFLVHCGKFSPTRSPQSVGSSSAGIESAGHLKYFGYWNDNGDDTLGLTNFVTISFNGTDSAAEKSEVAQIEKAISQGRNVLIAAGGALMQHKLDEHGWGTYYMNDNAAANWASLSKVVKPYASHIIAFYLVDEPDTVAGGRGPNFFNPILEQAASMIHADYSLPVAFNYGDTHLSTVIPKGINWVGLEIYGSIPADGGSGLKLLKSQLSADQKILILPPAYTLDGGAPANEAYDLAAIDSLMNYARNDDQVVGMLAFCYYSDYSDPTQKLRGANELPLVKEKFRQIYQEITLGDLYAPVTTPAIPSAPSAPVDPQPNPTVKGLGTVCVVSNSSTGAFFVAGPDQVWGWRGLGQICFSGHTSGNYTLNTNGGYGYVPSVITPSNALYLAPGGTITFHVSFGAVGGPVASQ